VAFTFSSLFFDGDNKSKTHKISSKNELNVEVSLLCSGPGVKGPRKIDKSTSHAAVLEIIDPPF